MIAKTKIRRPLAAMRKNCLECVGDGGFKAVKFCTCDGLHSTWCEFWPYRFGRRPGSVKDQRLITPECMPSVDLSLEDASDTDLKPLPRDLAAVPR